MSSNFTAVNPKIVGPLDKLGELRKDIPVASAQTWSIGAPIIITSGQATLCADGDIPMGLAASDIAAPAENTKVPVYLFQIGTRLEVYVSSGATAAAIGVANVGVSYDVQIVGTGADAIAYLDVGATTDKCWRVLDLAANYEPERNATANTPGKCVIVVDKVN